MICKACKWAAQWLPDEERCWLAHDQCKARRTDKTQCDCQHVTVSVLNQQALKEAK